MDAFHLSPSPALLQVGDADGGADGDGDGPFQLLDLLLASDADQAALASSAAARAGQESGGRGGAGLTGRHWTC